MLSFKRLMNSRDKELLSAGKIKNLAICILLFGVFFILSRSDAHGSSISWKRQQLDRTRENLRTVRKQVREANVREQDLSRQLNSAQNRLRTLKGEVAYINEKIKLSECDIKRMRAELVRLDNEHKVKQDKLQSRLRDIYLNQDNNFAEVLLCSKNFSDFANQSDFFRRISESDEKLVKTIRMEKQAIAFKRKQLDDKYNRMLSYRGRLKEKKVVLESIENKRGELLVQVEKERKHYQLRKYELEDQTYELEQEIQGMLRDYHRRNQSYAGGSSTPPKSTGRFGWPCGGSLTSDYGWRIHPIYGTSRFHTGIDLGAGYGSDIRAADGGQVIYSGWCGGYGYTVMIDHGKGITTLYAHCSSLYVSVGQSVAKGESIAAIGSTGNSTGPHLHFEVRQDGTPVSPWGFLR